MKKIFTYLLLASVMYILLFCTVACKSRKLSIDRSSSVDKTESTQTAQVKQESNSTIESKGSEQSVVTDQSGTWIWEEWYEKDKAADTTIAGIRPGLIHKRTTFVKNDITKLQTKDSSELSNHVENRDSIGTLHVQKDVEIKAESKDLDAKQNSDWIWPLVVILVVIGALIFIIRPLR